MPREPRDPADPEEWLRRARSSLARAKASGSIPDTVLEDFCFDAQQAVEKAIKAVLVSRNAGFPKTHSIADLLSLIEATGLKVPPDILESASLTAYAVEARYPGVFEEVTEMDAAEAVRLAERVFLWAEALVAGEHGV